LAGQAKNVIKTTKCWDAECLIWLMIRSKTNWRAVMNKEIKFWVPHGENPFFFIRVTRTNLMHHLSSVYFISQPLNVSGISVAHHQEVYYIYIYTGCPTS